MPKRVERSLTIVEWLTLVGALCSTGVCVTVYAFTNFEQKTDAHERESRLVQRIDELRENQKLFMQEMGFKYKATISP